MAQPTAFYSYSESYPVLQALTDEELGQLYRAKYEYFFLGAVPEFKSERMNFIWLIERPRLDKDKKAWHMKCVRNAYKAYEREHKEDPDKKDIVLWFIDRKQAGYDSGFPDPSFEALSPNDFTSGGLG